MVLIVILSVFPGGANAQEFNGLEMVKYDTNYVRVYKDELTTRVYLSRKQNGYTSFRGTGVALAKIQNK